MAEYLTNDELEQLTETLIENVQAESVRLGGLGKFDAKDILEVHDVLVNTITTIEHYATVVKTINGPDKRQMAIDIINTIVDIPFLPEFVEGSIIGWMIDILVTVFNKIGGKRWIDQLFQINEDGEIRFLGRE